MEGRILIIKHIENEGPGFIEDIFEDNGWKLDTIELEKGEKLPSCLDDVAAIITLGGPMNVYEEDVYPFLKDEEALLRKALIEEIPVLGICLGAQLIAKTCGATIRRASYKELGWYKLKLTKDGQKDALFRGLSKNLIVFQWHEDAFDIPQNGVLLAESRKCKNQAFRIGENVYGLQFHVEVTDDMIRSWMNNKDGSAGFRRIMSDSKAVKEDFTKQAKNIFLNFKSLVESSFRIKKLIKLFVEEEKTKTKQKQILWWDEKIHMFMSAECT